MSTLAHDIARRAHALDPAGLDTVLNSLGLSSWPQTVQGLSFQGWHTGGGCMMLVADLPGTGGHQVGITDGEAGFPGRVDTFWLGVMDPDGEELYTLAIRDGQRLPHG